MTRNLLGLLDSLVKSAAVPEGAKDAAGKVADTAGNVLGTATEGIRDAAGAINEKTGIGDRIDGVVEKVSGGQDTGELVGKAKELVTDNKLVAGLAAAGLGAMILRSKKGRELTGDAAKVGGAALIAGLAYKAFKNHQDGKPIIGGKDEVEASPFEFDFDAPREAAFEFPVESPEANEAKAEVLLKAMIGAAAADYRIDASEREAILGNARNAGLDQPTQDFLAAEFAEPARAEDFRAQAGDAELASQIYTAARITIDPDTQLEVDYLDSLAKSLDLDDALVANLNAVADSVRG